MKAFTLILKLEKGRLEKKNEFSENYKKYLKTRFFPLLKIYAENYFSERYFKINMISQYSIKSMLLLISNEKKESLFLMREFLELVIENAENLDLNSVF